MRNILLLISLDFVLGMANLGIPASAHTQPTIVSIICEKDPTAVGGYRKDREKLKLNEVDRQKSQFLVLLKSLLISQDMGPQMINETPPLEYILFTNQRSVFDEVNKTVAEWNSKFTKRLKLSYLPLEYPAEYKFTDNLFAPCATFRHLLSTILPHKDAIIYLDTDIIVLQDIQDLWETASRFQDAPDALLSAAPGFNKPIPMVCIPSIARVPSHQRPINSGVMLMNLTRIRQSDMLEWFSRLEPYWESFHECGAQSILSAYLTPSQVIPMDCTWNYRPFYFIKESKCGTRARILHGIDGFFSRNNSKTWKSSSGMAIFKLFEDAQLNDEDFDTNKFVKHIRITLRRRTRDYCIKNGNASFECRARKRFSQTILRN